MNSRAESIGRGAALKVTLLQAALLLTWTLYVLFLPRMAERAGLAREAVAWILLADQLLFVFTDWMAGVMADRLAATMARVGRWIALASLVSAAALVLMAPASRHGGTAVWAACLVVWAVSSSFLRAPAFSLLGRMGGVSRKSGVVNWALLGVALAGALGPLLSSAVAKLDPDAPLAVAAVVLALAAWIVSGLDRPAAGSAAPATPVPVQTPAPTERVRLVLGVLGCALAVQLHTVLVPQSLPGGNPQGMGWAVLFWVGFALGLPAAAWFTARGSEGLLRWLAMALGGALILAAARGVAAAWFVPVQLLAGAAWAAMFSLSLAWALGRAPGARGVGSTVGLLFSAIAGAAVLRLLTASAGWAPMGLSLAVAAWWIGAALLALPRAEPKSGQKPSS